MLGESAFTLLPYQEQDHPHIQDGASDHWGVPPFFDKSRHVMYRLIRSAKVRFPVKERDKIYVSPDAQDLITKLLIKNKDRRLGSKGGVEEILSHKFFDGLDIKKMLNFELKNPYTPKEGLFFDPRCLKQTTMEDTMLTPAEQQTIKKAGDKGHDPFADFTK